MGIYEPLASKYRPKKLEDFVGQQHLIGKDAPIRQFLDSGNIPSMIFWGPPGTGKTTLAYIISLNLFYDFHKLQAVTAGKDHLRKIIIDTSRVAPDFEIEGAIYLALGMNIS